MKNVIVTGVSQGSMDYEEVLKGLSNLLFLHEKVCYWLKNEYDIFHETERFYFVYRELLLTWRCTCSKQTFSEPGLFARSDDLLAADNSPLEQYK